MYILRKNWFILIIFLLLSCKKERPCQIFSTIEVDKENKTITFSSKLNFTTDTKYFLFYFEGYPWLKQHCIFVSSSSLKELQIAVAYIDWELWDKIYNQNFSPKLKIEVFYNGEWQKLENFITLQNFDFYQTTFWGTPKFDNFVLTENYKNFKCATCKFLPLEKNIILIGKKVLNYRFIKKLPNENLKFRIRF